MAVRDSMERLIKKVRFEIGDTTQPYVLTDQEIQDQLDRRRRDVRYAPLQVEARYAPGTVAQYTDFWSSEQNWEADAQLVDGSYIVLTPASSEPDLGHWTFSTGVITNPYLRVSGRIYDVYGSAADLCNAWLAKIKMEFSGTEDRTEPGGYSYTITGQKRERVQNLQDLERSLRRRAWVVTSRFTRPDLFPASGYRW